MTEPKQADAEQAAVALSQKFQRRVFSEVAEYWNDKPQVVLHALLEIAGGIGGAMVQEDSRRVSWIIGMIDALRDRIIRDAATGKLAQ